MISLTQRLYPLAVYKRGEGHLCWSADLANTGIGDLFHVEVNTMVR